MESKRDTLVRSIAMGVARSAVRPGVRPWAGTAPRDPEFEATVCESLRAQCELSGDKLVCLSDNSAPRFRDILR